MDAGEGCATGPSQKKQQHVKTKQPRSAESRMAPAGSRPPGGTGVEAAASRKVLNGEVKPRRTTPGKAVKDDVANATQGEGAGGKPRPKRTAAPSAGDAKHKAVRGKVGASAAGAGGNRSRREGEPEEGVPSAGPKGWRAQEPGVFGQPGKSPMAFPTPAAASTWLGPRQLRRKVWENSFDGTGRLHRVQQALRKILEGGVEDSIRAEVWEFLLGCHAPESTVEEREALRSERRKRYNALLRHCQTMHPMIGSGSLPYSVDDKFEDVRATSGARMDTLDEGSEADARGVGDDADVRHDERGTAPQAAANEAPVTEATASTQSNPGTAALAGTGIHKSALEEREAAETGAGEGVVIDSSPLETVAEASQMSEEGRDGEEDEEEEEDVEDEEDEEDCCVEPGAEAGAEGELVGKAASSVRSEHWVKVLKRREERRGIARRNKKAGSGSNLKGGGAGEGGGSAGVVGVAQMSSGHVDTWRGSRASMGGPFIRGGASGRSGDPYLLRCSSSSGRSFVEELLQLGGGPRLNSVSRDGSRRSSRESLAASGAALFGLEPFEERGAEGVDNLAPDGQEQGDESGSMGSGRAYTGEESPGMEGGRGLCSVDGESDSGFGSSGRLAGDVMLEDIEGGKAEAEGKGEDESSTSRCSFADLAACELSSSGEVACQAGVKAGDSREGPQHGADAREGRRHMSGGRGQEQHTGTTIPRPLTYHDSVAVLSSEDGRRSWNKTRSSSNGRNSINPSCLPQSHLLDSLWGTPPRQPSKQRLRDGGTDAKAAKDSDQSSEIAGAPVREAVGSAQTQALAGDVGAVSGRPPQWQMGRKSDAAPSDVLAAVISPEVETLNDLEDSFSRSSTKSFKDTEGDKGSPFGFLSRARTTGTLFGLWPAQTSGAGPHNGAMTTGSTGTPELSRSVTWDHQEKSFTKADVEDFEPSPLGVLSRVPGEGPGGTTPHKTGSDQEQTYGLVTSPATQAKTGAPVPLTHSKKSLTVSHQAGEKRKTKSNKLHSSASTSSASSSKKSSSSISSSSSTKRNGVWSRGWLRRHVTGRNPADSTTPSTAAPEGTADGGGDVDAKKNLRSSKDGHREAQESSERPRSSGGGRPGALKEKEKEKGKAKGKAGALERRGSTGSALQKEGLLSEGRSGLPKSGLGGEGSQRLPEEEGGEGKERGDMGDADAEPYPLSRSRTEPIKDGGHSQVQEAEVEAEVVAAVGTEKSPNEWLWTLRKIVVDVERTDRKLEYFAEESNRARMCDILAVHSWMDPLTGFCQGMCDLLTPFLLLFPDNADAFWCFEALFSRIRHNFLESGPEGIMRQLEALRQIVEVLDAELANHVASLCADNYMFCFRMLLVLFRRELPLPDVVLMWEMMWAADYDPAMSSVLVRGTPRGLDLSCDPFPKAPVAESPRQHMPHGQGTFKTKQELDGAAAARASGARRTPLPVMQGTSGGGAALAEGLPLTPRGAFNAKTASQSAFFSLPGGARSRLAHALVPSRHARTASLRVVLPSEVGEGAAMDLVTPRGTQSKPASPCRSEPEDSFEEEQELKGGAKGARALKTGVASWKERGEKVYVRGKHRHWAQPFFRQETGELPSASSKKQPLATSWSSKDQAAQPSARSQFLSTLASLGWRPLAVAQPQQQGSSSAPGSGESLPGLGLFGMSQSDSAQARKGMTQWGEERPGDSDIAVFCVVAILLSNRKQLLLLEGTDEAIKMFNDVELSLDVISCVQSAVRLRARYLRKRGKNQVP